MTARHSLCEKLLGDRVFTPLRYLVFYLLLLTAQEVNPFTKENRVGRVREAARGDVAGPKQNLTKDRVPLTVSWRKRQSATAQLRARCPQQPRNQQGLAGDRDQTGISDSKGKG